MDTQLQPWHIYTAIFVTFWAFSAYFDNFFITAVLCVAGGFGSDTFRKYLAADGNEEAGGHGDSSVKDVFVAPTKPLPPEPEVLDNETEKTNKDEDEDENEEDIEIEHQSMNILENAASPEKREVFEEETHLEQVDLLSNVPLTQPDVLEEEEETVEHVGEENDDEDKDSLDKFEAVSSHELAQQYRLEEEIFEPNEEIEESCHVGEAAKQLESGHHEAVERNDEDKFESVSKHDLEHEHQLEKEVIKLNESSPPEIEESCHVAESLIHLESEPHPDHHKQEEDNSEDEEPERMDGDEHKEAKEQARHKEVVLSDDDILLESRDDKMSPIQHSDEDFDKLSEHFSINDKPNYTREEDEEALPSLTSSEKAVSHEESLEKEDVGDYPAMKTSSKDFLSDFEPVLLDTRSRGKLEKVFDPNETVEENSSFEDEILLGPNKHTGSEEIVKPRKHSSEDVPGSEEHSPIRSVSPRESFASSKGKDLFYDDNAQPLFQVKPNEDKFYAKEAINDSFGSENFRAEPEQLLALDSPTSPSSLASPFQSEFREENFPSEKLEFISELSSFDSGPISDKFEPDVPSLTSDTKSSGTKDVEHKMVPSSFDARPLDVSHQEQPASHKEVKSESFEDEDKLSFLLEDAQRDGSDDEDEDEDEDELSKGHPSLEDEGDPWRAPRREPLDSAGESLSHPDSEDLPSRDDVSHRAVFGDDIDEEELLEEIESEEKNDDDEHELSGKESSSDDDSEGPDQVDSDDQVELMETKQDIKKIPSATTGASKLFDTDDEKSDKNLEKVPEKTKFDQPEVSFVKQEEKSSLDSAKAEQEMSFSARFEDPSVKAEIKFAAVEKMSPSFEEAKLISPVSSHHNEESSFGSAALFQDPQHGFHETDLLSEEKKDHTKVEELTKVDK